MKTYTDPRAILREEMHTDSRRGFRRGDTVPKRQFWPSPEAALAAMADSPVAFRLYVYADGSAGLSILVQYYVIHRAKRSEPWTDSKRRVLASCQYDADTQVSPSKTVRAVDPEEWINLQSRQHLRAVGIK